MDYLKVFKRVLLLAHSVAFFYIGHKIITAAVDSRRHGRILWASAGVAVHVIGMHLLREAYLMRIPALPPNPVDEPAALPINLENMPVFGPHPNPDEEPAQAVPNGQAYRIHPVPGDVHDDMEIVNDLIVLPRDQHQNGAN